MHHMQLAYRYFTARRGMTKITTFFALCGIVLGVAALIVVMSVMAGFRAELMDRILGVTGHVTVSSRPFTYSQATASAKALLHHPDIQVAEPFVQGQAMVMTRRGATGILIRGVELKTGEVLENNKVLLPFQKVTQGDVALLNHPNTIMLGDALARKIHASVGSTVTLVSPQGKTTPFGFMPKLEKFRVVALFNIGMHMYDSAWGYMSIPSAQKFYKMGEGMTGLDVRVKTPQHVGDLTSWISENAQLTSPFIQTWEDTNAQFFEALQVERVAMFIILALIVVVAAFNIITGQTMAVNDKRFDIAILRTMGARRRDILRIFLLNGCMIGILGTVLGVLMGVLIVENLKPIVSFLETIFHVSIFSGDAYFLDEIPTVLSSFDVLLVCGLSLGLSVLAAVQPAFKAAKMNPVEVFRS